MPALVVAKGVGIGAAVVLAIAAQHTPAATAMLFALSVVYAATVVKNFKNAEQ